MTNGFSKEEVVAWEMMIEGFEDALVLSKAVSIYNTNSVMMERAGDVIWRPQPYIGVSYSGADQTANFANGYVQLSVPASLNSYRSVPWTMTNRELRDALQEKRIGDAAKQKLASDINLALSDMASLTGTIVVKRTTAATGFDDVALCDSAMSEIGVPMHDRYAAFSTRDYNNMASNLAGRQTLTGKPLTAYDKAYVGNVSGFETFKLDYAYRLLAPTVAITGAVINGANQNYVPTATTTSSSGLVNINVDNRFQTISITVGTGTFKVGDCFTIAGVNSVHKVTKADTGQLKTFRVNRVVTGGGGTGTIEISPPIISGTGGAGAVQHKNVTATPANGAAITILNTRDAYANPFWQYDALELMPGRLAIPENTGVAVMRATTSQGIELVIQKFYDIKVGSILYRVDCLFGVVNKAPEKSGIILFSQV